MNAIYKRNGKIEWLEVMRGLAALWVVLHHAKQSADHFFGPIGEVSIIANGNLGVNFFLLYRSSNKSTTSCYQYSLHKKRKNNVIFRFKRYIKII